MTPAPEATAGLSEKVHEWGARGTLSEGAGMALNLTLARNVIQSGTFDCNRWALCADDHCGVVAGTLTTWTCARLAAW